MTKLKKDCTPAEWAKIRKRAKGYDAAQRKKPSRKKYTKRYNKKYVKTKAYRASDNARYDATRREKQLARSRLRAYGLSTGQVATILDIQNNACAICLRPFNKAVRSTKDCVDHCHDTKAVRGMLCLACNLAEGYIKQTRLSPTEFAARLRRYLSNPPARILEIG